MTVLTIATFALLSPALRSGRLGGVRMSAGGPNPDNLDRPCVDEICVTPGTVAISPAVALAAAGWVDRSGSAYAEESRKFRRTIYMHDEWTKHRSSERFVINMRTISKSGVVQALGPELSKITATAVFCVVTNTLLTGYQDFNGVTHASPLESIALVSLHDAFSSMLHMPPLS